MPLAGKAAQSATEFAALMMGFADIYEEMKVSEFYDVLLEKTGYMKALEDRDTVEDRARMENLLEFRSAILASETEAGDEGLALAAFLEKTALMSDVDNLDRSADAVVVMTLHSAKGLEFPVVFMPGMEEGLFPTIRAAEKDGDIEEERRLCYVGMTRAMDRLYLLRARIRTRYGRRDYTVESRFLTELDAGTLDTDADMPGDDLSGYLHRDFSGDWGGARQIREPGRGRIFDPLAAARAEVRARAGGKPYPAAGDETAGLSVVPELKPGDRVRHRKFGAGLVIEAEGDYATVMFDAAGRKKLALDVAPLEKE